METIVEKVARYIESDIEYYEGRVKRFKEGKEEIVQVAQRLDKSFTQEEVSFYGSNFIFNSKDSKEAFEVTTKLLALFPELEGFSKELNTGDGSWKWVGGVGDVVFIVTNATPDVNCTLKQEVWTYKSWICERR